MQTQTTIIFDTLAYAKKLKKAGFTTKQAEIQAETLAGLIDDKLATKKDLKELEVTLKSDIKILEVTLKKDIKELEVVLKRDIKELENNTKRDIKESELRLTVKMGLMLAASIAIISALVKLL